MTLAMCAGIREASLDCAAAVYYARFRDRRCAASPTSKSCTCLHRQPDQAGHRQNCHQLAQFTAHEEALKTESPEPVPELLRTRMLVLHPLRVSVRML